MKNKIHIKQVAKRILHADAGVQLPHIMNPVRDWWIGLFVALLVLVLCMVWGFNIYSKYIDVDPYVDEVEEVEVVFYREAVVKGVLDDLSKRRNEHESLVRQRTASFIELESGAEKESEEFLVDDNVSSSTLDLGGDINDLVENNFTDKIIYQKDSGLDEEGMKNDCVEQGGTFNTCGSPCDAEADNCMAVCVFTCEFSEQSAE